MSGMFIFSLDTEIAWGTYRPHEIARQARNFDRYRELVARLLALLERYDIAATWAVVGHLFLDACDGHPALPTPHYAWMPAPDSARDPCSDRARAPWYYGPDIIDMIRAARPAQEIGTHTFTHVIAGDPAVSRAIWDAQLAAAADLHAAHGLPIRSIVYPQNRIAYLDALTDYGIIAYRGEEINWYRAARGRLKRASHLLDRALGVPAPVYPLGTLIPAANQPVNLPASQLLLSYDGVRRLIPTSSRVRQGVAGLRRAAEREALYHLWTHPFNMGSSEAMFTALEGILREAARLRESGRIAIMTMAEAADHLRARGRHAGA